MKRILGIMTLASVALFAQDAAPQAEEAATNAITAQGAETINADMQAQIIAQPGELMEQVFEDYAKERKINYGTPNARGTVYITGKADVIANVNSANFVKSRTMAFERANQDAVAKMIMQIAGQESVESLREFFSDESSNKYEKPVTLTEVKTTLTDKISLLTEAAVDKALQKLDVPEEEYKGKSEAVKKNLFTDSIIKSSVRKAIFASSGFLTVQTFETRTEDGRYTIGVVLRYDADCKEIAHCLFKKQRPVITRDGGLTIEEALPTTEEMLTQFGVRLYFDETGMPSLLSFAQFGSAETSTDQRRQQRAMEHAMRQAANLANQQLTTYINSSIRVSEASEISESETEDIIFKEDEEAMAKNVTEYIDRLKETSKVTGFDSMAGRSTVYNKTLQHPSGHKISVVVIRWSFTQLDAARAIIEGKRPEQPKQPAKQTVNPENSGVRKGRTYDF